MPLPKSITSLLTAIVVAVPAAITTLALNKPKPPKEIDAVIQLDENREEIPENEIMPVIPAPPPIPPSPSQASSSGGSGGTGGVEVELEDAQSSGPESQEHESSEDTGPETSKDETSEETQEKDEKKDKEELEEEEVEEELPTDNDEDEDQGQSLEQQQESKDPSIQELEESIVSIIGILINEGKDFDIKNSRLYKQYTISSKLVELKKTIDSWKEKKDAEAKAAQDKGSSSATTLSTEQQSK